MGTDTVKIGGTTVTGQAVELAKRFGSDSSSRFVNGVLGALAAKENDVRQQLAAKVKKEAKAI